MTLIDDDGSTTEFAYDDTGQRTIERGPNGGETAFVNPWVSTRNKNELYKHIWVDDQRLAAQRDDGPYEELKRYFFHSDLQGSTNVVTDYRGDTFQHHEYFATGETWIDEASTIFRTPYQYAGGYVDDARNTINFGARWYDQDRELFYSPDPVLYDDATAIMERPALASAYAFAGSNPVTNIDPGGREFFTARNKAAVEAKHEEVRRYIARNPSVAAAVVANLDTRIPAFLVKRSVTTDPKTDRLQALSELLDNKPIVEIEVSEGTVSFSFTRSSTQPAANGPGRPTQPLPDPANGQPAIGPAAIGSAQAQVQPADAQRQQAPPRPTSGLPDVSGGVPRSDQ